MFKTKYRIVTDRYNGCEVQFKWWWLPIWLQGSPNTHTTLDAAKKYARGSAGTVIWIAKDPK